MRKIDIAPSSRSFFCGMLDQWNTNQFCDDAYARINPASPFICGAGRFIFSIGCTLEGVMTSKSPASSTIKKA